eukprot:7376466-Ditylum_brightwellii.AAC.1
METPARYAAANGIDYGTSEGWKHWLHSTARLLGELFDYQPEQFNPFLDTLMKRTWNSGWDIP